MGAEVPVGADHFLQRGPVAPGATFLFWTFIQAAGSLIGVGFMIRSYQIADAGRVSVMEYVILPASAFWAYVIWHQSLGWMAWAGMALIVVAGVVITFAGAGRSD